MSRLRTTIFAASLALTLSVHAVPREEPHTAKGTAELQYRLVELPDLTPDGAQGSTVALSINDRGEVLGSATRGTGNPGEPDPTDYVIWRHGKIAAVLKSPDPALPFLSLGNINNRSEVVGTMHTDVENPPTTGRAFIWRRGQFTVLGPLPTTGASTQGRAINDWGEVAGSAEKTFIAQTTFRWFRGRFEEMPTGPADSAFPLSINNFGQIVGNRSEDPGTTTFRGYVWNRKGSPRYLDSLPGAESMFARAINDRGQIVGTTNFPDPVGGRAFLWERGNVMDLGTLPGSSSSVAVAINVFGTVVGHVVYRDTRIHFAAMLWRDGEMHDLNELIADDDPLKPSVFLEQAFDINNFGWIAAIGGGRGYVLIPVWKHRR